MTSYNSGIIIKVKINKGDPNMKTNKFLEVVDELKEALDCGGYPDRSSEELKLIEEVTGVNFDDMSGDEIVAFLLGLSKMYEVIYK